MRQVAGLGARAFERGIVEGQQPVQLVHHRLDFVGHAARQLAAVPAAHRLQVGLEIAERPQRQMDEPGHGDDEQQAQPDQRGNEQAQERAAFGLQVGAVERHQQVDLRIGGGIVQDDGALDRQQAGSLRSVYPARPQGAPRRRIDGGQGLVPQRA